MFPYCSNRRVSARQPRDRRHGRVPSRGDTAQRIPRQNEHATFAPARLSRARNRVSAPWLANRTHWRLGHVNGDQRSLSPSRFSTNRSCASSVPQTNVCACRTTRPLMNFEKTGSILLLT
jgi:hypothetical protein